MLSVVEDDQKEEFQNSSKEALEWVLLRDNLVYPFELKVPA